MRPLYKTTIVIWSETDPTGVLELEELAMEATNGESYCSSLSSDRVEDPSLDPHWDGTEFFDSDEEEETEEVDGEVCVECGLRIPDHTVLLKSNYHTETCSMYGPQDNI